MKNVFAAIQAGGRSARMGADKAWVTLAKRPLIDSALRAAQPLAQRFAIVISKEMPELERYQELANAWGADILIDPNNHCGPLGGIQTALRHCTSNETALILACDLPFITSDFLTLLAQHHSHTQAPAITIPLDQSGRRQMLAGFYDLECLPAVESLLAEEKLRVDGLCGRVNLQEVAYSAYCHLPGASRLLTNLNTPDELRAAALAYAMGA